MKITLAVIDVRNGRNKIVGRLKIPEEKLTETVEETVTLEWQPPFEKKIKKITLPLVKTDTPYLGWHVITKWKQLERLKRARLLLHA